MCIFEVVYYQIAYLAFFFILIDDDFKNQPIIASSFYCRFHTFSLFHYIYYMKRVNCLLNYTVTYAVLPNFIGYIIIFLNFIFLLSRPIQWIEDAWEKVMVYVFEYISMYENDTYNRALSTCAAFIHLFRLHHTWKFVTDDDHYLLSIIHTRSLLFFTRYFWYWSICSI